MINLAVVKQIEQLQQFQQDMSELPEMLTLMIDQLKIWVIVVTIVATLVFILRAVESVKRMILMREMKKYYVRENKKAAQEELNQKRAQMRDLNQK